MIGAGGVESISSGPRSPSASDLARWLDAQRIADRRDGAPPLDRRLRDLEALKRAVLAYQDRFVEAVSADFGHRSRQETRYLDLLPVVTTIGYLRANLARWMRPEPRRVALHFRPGRARVVYQPLGVVGIIAPWNYPVVLALTPLATALAAGNRVMLKPSESTPRTSALLAMMLAELFPPEQVTVVLGDATVAAAFAALPFDRLVFTGSTPVGRAVMRAASANLVPVTLELGGKSPAIVERGTSLRRAAHAIAFGKLTNAGQTCIAPDYALVARDEVGAFVEAFAREVDRYYPRIATNPDYATIIDDRHHARLHALLDDARTKGATVQEISAIDDDARRLHPRTFLPAVVTGVTDAMALMREEIFGPILPVVAYDGLEEAIGFVNARPRPLALYFFGGSGPAQERVLAQTTSGNVTVNDTILHYAQDDLPFGGVGASGMGAYHGHEGFKTMSHAKGIFTQPRLNAADVIRPPFGRLFERVLAYLLR
ncbi:coniferyl aldehyde dehydrogenase [uncultured Methylobacterium sp.]|uniref:coniferyl aldehyde dehydrogenase n=1 Tax=uncultured Methylobacterium sp. TaxID=157278 RepID=UPI0035CA580E